MKKTGSFAAISFILVILLAIGLVLNFTSTDQGAKKIVGNVEIDNGDEKINWERYQTKNVALEDSLTITESGTYYLTGSLSDGYVAVNTDHDSGKVRLILSDVTIKNSSGPAIICHSADDLVIELVGDNYLEDGSIYKKEFDEDVSGVIYSKDDLTFTGSGGLTIVANYQDGIVSKDDLKFSSGTYKITSKDDGIRGKDSVYIVSGEYTIETQADAIKSTNETTAGKGFVLIKDGKFSIDSGAKGIKATNSIIIYSGNYEITSYDDALHSNNYIGVLDGVLTISSGDDGIHADKEIIIDGGSISISKSYEGLEAQVITINDGNISVVSSDDGLNAGGGADSSANNRMGAGPFDVDLDCILSINGGTVSVNAAGDGIDSNGYLYFNGGSVIVDGPTNNGNGALDASAGIIMNGGTVIAVGASGMAESLGKNSSVYNLSVFFENMYPANSKVVVKDSQGQVILQHISLKSFDHLAAGTSDFKLGESYTICIDNEDYTNFTISDTTTILGNFRKH